MTLRKMSFTSGSRPASPEPNSRRRRVPDLSMMPDHVACAQMDESSQYVQALQNQWRPLLVRAFKLTSTTDQIAAIRRLMKVLTEVEHSDKGLHYLCEECGRFLKVWPDFYDVLNGLHTPHSIEVA